MSLVQQKYLHFDSEGELTYAIKTLPRRVRANHEGFRRSPRRPFRTLVTLRDEQGWGPVHLHSVDISETGIFVASELFFQVGDCFWLEFHTPGSAQRVRARAFLARVAEHPSQSPGRKSGMAFEFAELPDWIGEEIETFATDQVRVKSLRKAVSR